jgi:hypothetical protein
MNGKTPYSASYVFRDELRTELCLGAGAHTGYWQDAAVAKEIVNLIGRGAVVGKGRTFT